jgi:hypothetical protein
VRARRGTEVVVRLLSISTYYTKRCLGLVVGVYGRAARVAISGRRSSPKLAQALIIIIGVSCFGFIRLIVLPLDILILLASKELCTYCVLIEGRLE